jgi:hypothetical protein
MAIGSEVQTHIGRRANGSAFHPVWYVCSLPQCTKGSQRAPKTSAEQNSDWGWTAKRSEAMQLSAYWQRRFLAEGRRIGRARRIE